MNTTKCLFNSAIALRQIFINNSNGLASDATTALTTTQRQAGRAFLPPLSCHQPPPLTRSFSTQLPLFFHKKKKHFQQQAQQQQPQKNLPRDWQITEPMVHLVQDGRLSQPLRTQDILRNLDPTTESLRVVSMPGPRNLDEDSDLLNVVDTDDNNGGRGRPVWPVCKIVDTAKERAEQREKEKEARKKNVSSKELDINWGIAMNDLETTKLRQLRKFLAKGMTVQLTLVNKAGLRRAGKKHVASVDEAKAIVKAIKAAVADVPGSVELKTEGSVGKQMIITYQGPAGGYTPPAEAPGAAETAS